MELLFPYEISRTSYFFRALLNSLICTLIKYEFPIHGSALRAFVTMIVGLALLVYVIFFIVRPRCNDIGIHWTWSFLTLVPYLNLLFGLYLLFWPSKADNL